MNHGKTMGKTNKERRLVNKLRRDGDQKAELEEDEGGVLIKPPPPSLKGELDDDEMEETDVC